MAIQPWLLQFFLKLISSQQLKNIGAEKMRQILILQILQVCHVISFEILAAQFYQPV